MKKLLLMLAFAGLAAAPSWWQYLPNSVLLRGPGDRAYTITDVTLLSSLSELTDGLAVVEDGESYSFYFDSSFTRSKGIPKKYYVDKNFVVTHMDHLNDDGTISEKVPCSPYYSIFVDFENPESRSNLSRFLLGAAIVQAEVALTKSDAFKAIFAERVRKNIENIDALRAELELLGGPLTAEDRRK